MKTPAFVRALSFDGAGSVSRAAQAFNFIIDRLPGRSGRACIPAVPVRLRQATPTLPGFSSKIDRAVVARCCRGLLCGGPSLLALVAALDERGQCHAVLELRACLCVARRLGHIPA